MFLLPHCGLLFTGYGTCFSKTQGFYPETVSKKTDLTIGMDSGIIMKNPSVLTTGILLMPVAIAVAFILRATK